MHLPKEHENSGWHQEDLVAGDELQDVLLVGCKFIQEVSDEHQAARAHRLQRQTEAVASRIFQGGTRGNMKF